MNRVQIREVTLHNWKCYKEQTINLRQSEEKNIAVIFGSNGFGKTSLLEAIRWCLYGPQALKSTEVLARFNRAVVAHSPTTELSVRIGLSDGTSNLRITRRAKRLIRGSATVIVEIGEAELTVDGIEQTNAAGRIDAMLPFACSEFYFFDGVEIKRYAQSVHSADMRTAIERILGIPELRHLREDAQKAMSAIDAELRVVQAAQPELQSVGIKLDEKEDERNVLSEQIQLAESEHEASQDILEQLRSEASKQEALRSQFEELERKRREVDRLMANIDEVGAAIEQAQRQIPISLLTGFVRDIASDMQRKTISSARRSGLTAQVKSILDSGMCICGRPVDQSSEEYLKAGLAAPADVNVLRQTLTDENIRGQLEILSLYKAANWSDLLAKRDRLSNDLDGLQQEIRDLGGAANLPTISAAELWMKVGEAEANVMARRESVTSLRRDLETIESEINNLYRQREKLASRSKETAVLGRQSTLARRLKEAADDLISWRIDETRDVIELETSRIHAAVTNKPEEYRGVEISPDDYSIKLRASSGLIDPDTLSAGEKEALAFSFIAGLNLASGKSAPFVMDTPFGHLDASHQKNLIAALPRLPSQVTLLATDRDLPEALMEELQPHISDVMTIARMGSTDDASIIET